MSAALSNPMLRIDRDWSQWIEASDAARILGVTRRHMARECEGRLVASSLAMKAAPPEGGVPRWYVARRHDPRLARGDAGASQQPPQLADHALGKVQEAMEKRACIDALRERGSCDRAR